MTRLLTILAVLAANYSAGLNSSPAWAANPPGHPDRSACTRATKLAAGDAAPCAGDLLPTSVVAELLRAQDLSRQLASDLAHERELAAAFRASAVDALALSTEDDLVRGILRFAALRRQRRASPAAFAGGAARGAARA